MLRSLFSRTTGHGLSLLAILALTLFVSAPVFAEPRGEATRSAEIAVPDPFAVPAARIDVRWEGPARTATAPTVSRSTPERVLNLELKRAESIPGKPATAPQAPASPTSDEETRGLVPPVPELELRGF